METKPLEPSLEIRINSVEDAKSVVRNMRRIEETREALGLSSIEFVVAEEIHHEVNGIVFGIFKAKSYKKVIACQNGNKLFNLPHFHIPIRPGVPTAAQPVPVRTQNGVAAVGPIPAPAPAPAPVKNKGGRPKRVVPPNPPTN